MNNDILGIDLGTSSVKVLLKCADGEVKKSSYKYAGKGVEGWKEAVIKAMKSLDLSRVSAIGLSSQVGTYITNSGRVISWQSEVGRKELDEVKARYDKQTFIEEISMPHPDIISYPIPRIKHIKSIEPNVKSIYQPKDEICRMLTGRLVSDIYSWRGLADIKKKDYSSFFIKQLGIDENVLPPLAGIFENIGGVTDEVSAVTGVPSGTPVFTGLNDYYASLIGMGINSTGQLFDITGTSEHLGILEKELNSDTKLVSSEYFGNYVTYGVTASSGVSLDFAIKNLPINEADISLCKSAPIFTPYLNGERAPIFDADAMGSFIGITGATTAKDMAYAVLEGVAFSVYHIFEELGNPAAEEMIISGGAAKNPLLNQIKATIFGCKVITLKETDTSALGAVMVAGVGAGIYDNITEAAKALCKKDKEYLPCEYTEVLRKRFEIYKRIYPALKGEYKKIKEIVK